MQVQRGLGASKLAINSVGGTLNIITKATDMKKGAVFCKVLPIMVV
jgi:outer membrane receptor protein involved in Fe transport